MPLHLERIVSTEAPHFAPCWELYEKAFPLSERRELDDPQKLLDNERYHFEVALLDDNLIGFLLWWNFDRLRYVEHMATLPAVRGQGQGARILQALVQRESSPLLLEVEPPQTTIQQRRIDFYTRLGFILSDHDYRQPAMNTPSSPITMLLMSAPGPVSLDDIRWFVAECHPLLYPT